MSGLETQLADLTKVVEERNERERKSALPYTLALWAALACIVIITLGIGVRTVYEVYHMFAGPRVCDSSFYTTYNDAT